MTAPVELIDNYIAIWNEADAERRRALIAATWTEDARYVDPLMQGEGREGIDQMIAAVQARFPGFAFKRTSDVDAHPGGVRFSWALGPAHGEPLAGGVDFGQLSGERLQSITGFLDFAPAG